MKVTVTWDAVAHATSYTVYKSTAAGTQGNPIGTTVALVLADTNVTPGSTYYYGVVASNASGDSALSAQDDVSVPTVPNAPTNVVATLEP